MPLGRWRDLRLYPPRTLSVRRRMSACRPKRRYPLNGADAAVEEPDL